MPMWVREFYESYTQLFLKGEKKVGSMAPLEFVRVRGRMFNAVNLT